MRNSTSSGGRRGRGSALGGSRPHFGLKPPEISERAESVTGAWARRPRWSRPVPLGHPQRFRRGFGPHSPKSSWDCPQRSPLPLRPHSPWGIPRSRDPPAAHAGVFGWFCVSSMIPSRSSSPQRGFWPLHGLSS